MITPLPGVTPTKPGSATFPFFGVEPAIVNEKGEELGNNQGGFLVIKQPWPSMLRTLFKADDRFKEVYWSRFQKQGWYLAGDGAVRDADGYLWILGRIDDVLNVSGHRLSTMEVESALVAHETVVEAAVVGFKHEVKGEGVAAFVILAKGAQKGDKTTKDLQVHVRNMIGALAVPDQIHFTEALPKTRSGKIMRRLLRDVANGVETKGDMSTLGRPVACWRSCAPTTGSSRDGVSARVRAPDAAGLCGGGLCQASGCGSRATSFTVMSMHPEALPLLRTPPGPARTPHPSLPWLFFGGEKIGLGWPVIGPRRRPGWRRTRCPTT